MPKILKDEQKQQLADLSKALAHPARIGILQTLCADSCCNTDIVACLPLAQSTVSQHVKILQQAGLLTVRQEQQKRFYCVNRDKVTQLKQLINEL